MNFNRLVLETLEEKWVLILKERSNKKTDEVVEMVYQIKPFERLTNEEKNALQKIKVSLDFPNTFYKENILGWPQVTYVVDQKNIVEKQLKDLKNVYGSVMREEMSLEPELEPHWRGVIDEL